MRSVVWTFVGAAFLALSGNALAHPHVRVEARAVLSYAPGGGLAAVRHEWTFDPAYSAFLSMGVARDAAGEAGGDAMASLASTTVASLAASDDFTWLKADGVRPALAAAFKPAMRLRNGQVTLTFELPLKEPAARDAALLLEVMDPTYFVAFSFAPGDDAVRLEGAPAGCSVTVVRPKGFDGETTARLAAGALDALLSPDAAEAVTNRATVACR